MGRIDGTVPFSSQLAIESYAAISDLSIGYQTSVTAIVDQGIAPFIRKRPNAKTVIWEDGGGQGKSGYAIKKLLEQRNLANFSLLSAEKVAKQVREGRVNLNGGSDFKLLPPFVLTDIQYPPLPDEYIDIHVTSQVDHWIVPRKKLLEAYKEEKRALKKEGLLVHAVSGIVDLDKLNRLHFTRSPFYQNAYLPAFKEELIRNDLWNESLDPFVPWNPNVNPFYYQYSLSFEQDNGLPRMLLDAGFNSVDVVVYFASLDVEEMRLRMTNLAMVNMHLAKGPIMQEIPENQIQRLSNAAFTRALRRHMQLYADLAKQQKTIMKELPEEEIYGEPVPVIIARKKL